MQPNMMAYNKTRQRRLLGCGYSYTTIPHVLAALGV